MTEEIVVIGVSAGGAKDLPAGLLATIASAEILCGGARQLSYFPESRAERIAVTGDIAALATRLDVAAQAGRRVVVLASGDPLFYGLGASLRRYLTADRLRIHPQPSSVQLAFARLGEPWHDAQIISLHGKRQIAPLIMAARTADRIAILTDDIHTPAWIGEELQSAGVPDRPVAICERLGSDDEKIIRATLSNLSTLVCDPLNVLILLPPTPSFAKGKDEGQTGEFEDAEISPSSQEKQNDAIKASWGPGLTDEIFARKETAGEGLLTKREVRVLSLGALGLQPGEVLWDIGAGSGSLAIEAARLPFSPAIEVYAIERDLASLNPLRENCTKLALGVHIIEGSAPEVCRDLPAPDAVFIGGSGGALERILHDVIARQGVRVRIVLNLATIENLVDALKILHGAGVFYEMLQVNIARGGGIGGGTRLVPLNPVFIVRAWRQ